MDRKSRVDIYNYFSIEILENIGIEKPNQIQIDKVENSLKKITKLLKNKLTNGSKSQMHFLVQ
jgi:hypothetical protein